MRERSKTSRVTYPQGPHHGQMNKSNLGSSGELQRER